MLTSIAKSQAPLQVGVDSCCVSDTIVCGRERFARLKRGCVRAGLEMVQKECSGSVYRFGAGSECTAESWMINGGWCGNRGIPVDVIAGSLPALLGSGAARQLGLLVDLHKSQLLQRHSGGLRVVGEYREGEIPNVSLLQLQGSGGEGNVTLVSDAGCGVTLGGRTQGMPGPAPGHTGGVGKNGYCANEVCADPGVSPRRGDQQEPEHASGGSRDTLTKAEGSDEPAGASDTSAACGGVSGGDPPRSVTP